MKVLGTSQGTVTRAAEIAGVSFSRSPQLAEAAAIASLNAKQLRTELELQLLRAGLLAAQRLATGNFEDARDLIVIAGVAHDKSVNQERLTLQTGKAPADESDMARYFEHILGGGKADDEPRKYVYPKDDE
nr:hypothetical protein [Rhodococcus sp. (in: high G+C Gram-positive bacteria)]